MQLRNDQLAERILEAAKSEFLEKGYRQASVRSIAASVGVTTGALYRYYANKEALFDALVSGPADYLYDQCKSFSEAYSRQELDEQLANLPELTRNSDGGTSDFLKYIYQNYDAFKLIVCCSAGTKYEDYPERLIAIETASSAALVHLMQKAGRLSSDLDDTMIHIVVVPCSPAYLRSLHMMHQWMLPCGISRSCRIFTLPDGTKFWGSYDP